MVTQEAANPIDHCFITLENTIADMDINEQDIVYRLRRRAEIRRQIPGRRSVQEGKPDRLADLLDEAAAEIERLQDQQQLHNR